MAQLVKLRDYISRYEANPFHYPTQFIRLKRENWQKLHTIWERENTVEQEMQFDEKGKEKGFFDRLKLNRFTRKQKVQSDQSFEGSLPQTKEKLRRYFLNELYPFQLKWATSTLTQVSYTSQRYYFDERLKFLLQHFPDLYLIMYYPIFNIKNAPIDGDIIIISPIQIEIISLIETEEDATIVVTDDRSWTIEYQNEMKQIISPVISLKRTEQIINSIFNVHDLQFEIKKTVLAPTANFLYYVEPYKTSLTGRREFNTWYNQKRQLSGSLKGEQLKAMSALLEHCLTTSVRRPEWEISDDEAEQTFI